MESLIKLLQKEGVLKSENLLAALRAVDRKDFVPEQFQHLAYEDTALPIGEGQTISQPYTVVFMLELLAPRENEQIMEAGFGSGWQTALLARAVGKNGRIYAIELIASLCELGRRNAVKYSKLAERAKFYCQDAAPGLPEEAGQVGGFDAIIAAAAVQNVPMAWRRQLKIGGRLVYPRTGSVFKEVKIAANKFSTKEYPGFVFVPFVAR